MALRNQDTHWGLISVFFHFIIAFAIIGLFALGWWMTGLGYYDPWYKQGPFIHKSIGIIIFALMAARLLWRFLDTPPKGMASHTKFEKKAAKLVHIALYLLTFTILISGYLISTADGRPISVFDYFQVPATIQSIDQQEDIAGAVHWYVACILMGFVGLHVLGALKHQFIDKDGTLTRMLGRKPN